MAIFMQKYILIIVSRIADTDGGAYSPFRSILLVLTHDQGAKVGGLGGSQPPCILEGG